MFNASDIIRNNNATFYDFETHKRRNQRLRVVTICLIAFIAAIIFPKVSDNLLAGFLAVQSILLGFTFNVMFFLIANHENGQPKEKSIESQLRAERVVDLYHELFYNVSYFNLIAIGSIVIATLLLLPVPQVPEFLRGFPSLEEYVRWLATSKIPTVVSSIVHGSVMFVFYTASIEVVFTIARVIGRTFFYFERKMGKALRTDSGNEH